MGSASSSKLGGGGDVRLNYSKGHLETDLLCYLNLLVLIFMILFV